jgi:rhodanese-related sulfurtransferase
MVISTEELKKMIDENSNYILIDVRRDEELKHGMIPTAKHLILDDFQEAFDLSKEDFKEKYGFDKPKTILGSVDSEPILIIVHCRSGGRSDMAANYLRNKGYNVRNYQGSVKAWSEIDDNVNMY